MRSFGGIILALTLGVYLGSPPPSQAAQKPDVTVRHRLLCYLQNEEVSESSGLAVSRYGQDIFWTHNDSGGQARVFAFDARGRDLAVFRISGARVIDWEDMTSVLIEERPHLVVGDTGDNARKRESYRLYVFREPRLDPQEEGRRSEVIPAKIVEFRFEDGSHDCEAIAGVPETPTILLATKHGFFRSDLYRLDLPAEPLTDPLVARHIARVPVPLVTAMDISRDGRRLLLVTYGPGIEYTRKKREGWAEALEKKPTILELPDREQGESVAYGPEAQRLYLTSEGVPMPLWEVRVER